MLGKKTCSQCGKSLRNSYDFCPYCGRSLTKKKKDFGMIGKTDGSAINPEDFKISGGFNSIVNSLMRSLERQYRDIGKDEIKEENFPNPNRISISISSFDGMMPQVSINDQKKPKSVGKKRDDIKRFFFNNFNSEKLGKYSKLPKAEPKTNIRRLSNKVVYEVELPGVKSAKDISIINLEKSMELKAISDKKAYVKTVPMNFPILNYKLSNGKLVLEMDVHED